MVGETAKRKGAPFLALLVMLIILLHTSDCGATFSSIINGNATSPYHGRMDEPDWMFDSETSRMLADKGHVTDGAKNPYKESVSDCNRPPKYLSCLPPKSGGGSRPQNCATYTRNCG